MGTSLFARSGRVRGLTEWLADGAPPEAAHLRLVVRDGEAEEVLQRWAPDDANATIAQRLEDLVQDLVQETGQTVTGIAQWVDGSGNVLQSKRMVLKPPRTEVTAMWEGNAQSVLAQTQAHQQVLMDHFVAGMRYSVEESGKRTHEAYERVVSLTRENAKLRAEVDSLSEELVARTAETAIEKAEADAEGDPVENRMLGYMDMAAQSFVAGRLKKGAANGAAKKAAEVAAGKASGGD